METNQRDTKDKDGEYLVVSSGERTQNVEKSTEIPNEVVSESSKPTQKVVSSSSSENDECDSKSDDGKPAAHNEIETKCSSSAEDLCTSSSENCTGQSKLPQQCNLRTENITHSTSGLSENNGDEKSVSDTMTPRDDINSKIQQEATTDSNLGTTTEASIVQKKVEFKKEISTCTSMNITGANTCDTQEIVLTGSNNLSVSSTKEITQIISNTVASNTQTDSKKQKPLDTLTGNNISTDVQCVARSDNTSTIDTTVTIETIIRTPVSNTQIDLNMRQESEPLTVTCSGSDKQCVTSSDNSLTIDKAVITDTIAYTKVSNTQTDSNIRQETAPLSEPSTVTCSDTDVQCVARSDNSSAIDTTVITETIVHTPMSNTQIDSNIRQESEPLTVTGSGTNVQYVPSNDNTSTVAKTVSTERISHTPVSNTQTDSIGRETTTAVQKETKSSTENTDNNPKHGQKTTTVNKVNLTTKSQEHSISSSTHQSEKKPQKGKTPKTAKSAINDQSKSSANEQSGPSKQGSKRKSTSNDSEGSSISKKKKNAGKKKKRKQDSGDDSEESQPPPPPVDLDEEWNITEKKRLLEALKTDRGRRWWGRMASKVISKNVEQVKHHIEILRAKANDTMPIHLDEVDNPLQAWIAACKQLVDCQDNIDAKFIPQVMTIAAVEPTTSQGAELGPNYGKIYTFLSSVLRDQPNMQDLSPIDAKVVLELLHNLETRVSSADSTEQVSFLRTKYKTINKELEQEQIVCAIKQLEREIQSEMTAIKPGSSAEVCGSTRSTAPLPASGVTIVGAMVDRTKVQKTSMQSSLNPVNVPVSLLNLITKNKH